MIIIRINTDNTMTELKSNKNWINTIKKDSNNSDINLLYEWYIDSNSKLLLYGHLDGEQINNHILPSNGISSIISELNCNILYDNIYIVKLEENKLVNYSIQEYGEFYSINYDTNNSCSESDDELYEYKYTNSCNTYIDTNININNILSYDNNIY